MSIFSKLRGAKKAAKEHKQKAASEKTEGSVKVPYKHVPSHAAVDALSGAPSSWQLEDKPRIRAEHSKRSIMTLGRTDSSLSQLSPLGGSGSVSPAASMPVLPRNASYSSYNPTWWDRGDTDHIRKAYIGQLGGQSKMARSSSYLGIDSSLGSSIRISPVMSKDASPAESSSNSAASVSSNPPELNSQYTFANNNIFDRLHTNTSRKIGEAPVADSPVVVAPVAKAAAVVPVEKQKRSKSWLLKGKGRDSGVDVSA